MESHGVPEAREVGHIEEGVRGSELGQPIKWLDHHAIADLRLPRRPVVGGSAIPGICRAELALEVGKESPKYAGLAFITFVLLAAKLPHPPLVQRLAALHLDQTVLSERAGHEPPAARLRQQPHVEKGG